MKALVVAYGDSVRRARDVRTVAVLFLTPVVLTGVLGTALGRAFEGTVPPFSVGWVGAGARLPVDRMIKDAVEAGLPTGSVRFTELTSEQEARSRVGAGDLAAAVSLPEGFAEAVEAGRPTHMRVLVDPGQAITAHLVVTAAKRLANEISRQQTAALTAARALIQEEGALRLLMPDSAARLSRAVETASAGVRVRVDQVQHGRGDNPLNAMDFYAASMSTVYLLFMALFWAKELAGERESGVWARLLVTPARWTTIVAGKALAFVALSSALMAVLVVATRDLFGVHWGTSGAGLAAILGAAVIASAGLGLLLAGSARQPSAVEATGGAALLIMSLLGGAMFPLFGMPDWLQSLSRFTLNRWALDGLLVLIFEGGTLADVAVPAAVLVAMGATFGGAGAFLLARR